MIKSILVPMGNSEFSRNSLKVSAAIANRLQARLSLLHVRDISKLKDLMLSYKAVGSVSLDVPVMTPAQGEYHMIEAELEKEKQIVEKYYDEIKPQLTADHRFLEAEGEVPDEILKVIPTVDLVVMAKAMKNERDCTDVSAAIMKVVQHTNKPLLALCEEKEIGGHALVAYDGSRSSNNALRVIGDLSVFFNKITVLTVKKTKEEALPLLEEASLYLEPYKLEVETVHKTGHPMEQILEVTKDRDLSLIFMGGYGDNKLKEMLVGSVTEQVLKHTTIPVLLCNG